jgi:hypothetical protein
MNIERTTIDKDMVKWNKEHRGMIYISKVELPNWMKTDTKND